MAPSPSPERTPVDLHSRRTGTQAVVFDAARIAPPGPDAFALHANGAVPHADGETDADEPTGGRGATVFTRLDGFPVALRHYRRGGILGERLGDRYLRTPLAWTRPWREAHLLAALHNEGLPVPAPLAARVVFDGVWYRGELITHRLADTQTLAQRMTRGALPASLWHAIGATIARLHHRGIDHADLNAHNILIADGWQASDDAPAGIWIIDLDRARVRTPKPQWQRRNLQRLERSCLKLATLARRHGEPFFPLEGDQVEALIEGWNQ